MLGREELRMRGANCAVVCAFAPMSGSIARIYFLRREKKLKQERSQVRGWEVEEQDGGED